jgi:RND superfamily putative drug exporter
MRSLAVGAIVVGIVSVIASATLLPALLRLLGDRVDALRIPLVGRRSLEAANPEGRFWGATSAGCCAGRALAWRSLSRCCSRLHPRCLGCASAPAA